MTDSDRNDRKILEASVPKPVFPPSMLAASLAHAQVSVQLPYQPLVTLNLVDALRLQRDLRAAIDNAAGWPIL